MGIIIQLAEQRTKHMLTIIVATITFLLLDALWLGIIAKQMYITAFGDIMRLSNGSIQAYWPAAIVVYIALLTGIIVFVIPKANGNTSMALLWGALFGFITYATYDFTNLAVLSQWSLKISIIDTLWGIVLCSLTSFISVFVTNKFS